MSKRLDLHSIRWRMRGFPIFGDGIDDDEDEIVGVITEDEWRWADLTADEQAWVEGEIADYLAACPEDRPDVARMMVLGHHGIAHEHRWVYDEPYFRECSLCRMAETLPGRIVDVDGRLLRVTDPPPRWLDIPRPTKPTVWTQEATVTAEALTVDRYRWDPARQRYV